MTRSEERLNVGTERQATGRVRLRKYVTTENVTQTVPVQREEVRIEREPITDANRAEPCPVRTSAMRNTKSPSTRSVPSLRRKPSPSNGSGSTRKP